MKGDAVRLAQLSSQIQTVAAAVGVLGVARSQLAIAAQGVDLIPAAYVKNDAFAAGWAFLTGQTQSVQAQLRDEIGQAQAEVEKYAAFYKGYSGDDLEQEISTVHSMGIASTCQHVNKVINDLIDDVTDAPTISALDFVGGVEDVLRQVVISANNAITAVAQGAANTAAGIVSAFWVPLVVVGAGALLFIAWERGLLKGGG